MSAPTVAPDVGAPAVPEKRTKARPARPPGARGGLVFPTIFMLAFLVYFLMPLFWLLVASTKSLDDLFDSFGLWFANFNLIDNIRDTFNQDNGVYLDWLRNKFSFRGKNLMFWFVLGSVMVPTTALAIPTYLMFAKLGFTNNPLAVILPSLVSPFGIYLMRIYAEASVPTDLLEAARIDGASEFRTFRQIAFRLLVPGFVTVLLFNFVATWNNYFLPLVMLSEPKWYPLTVGLQQWNSQATAGGGATSAFNIVITGSLLSIVPLILAFVFLQRYWQSGLGSGGVKG
jgi:multiple sugar transport system permease protein